MTTDSATPATSCSNGQPSKFLVVVVLCMCMCMWSFVTLTKSFHVCLGTNFTPVLPEDAARLHTICIRKNNS